MLPRSMSNSWQHAAAEVGGYLRDRASVWNFCVALTRLLTAHRLCRFFKVYVSSKEVFIKNAKSIAVWERLHHKKNFFDPCVNLAALMTLLLANQSDCYFFRFWFQDRLCDGITYDAHLFYQAACFQSQHRDHAYAVASDWLERGLTVIICCMKNRYIVGVGFHGEWQQVFNEDLKRSFSVSLLQTQ